MYVQVYTFKQLMEGVTRGKFREDELVYVRDMEEIMECFLHVYGIKVEIEPEHLERKVVG